MTNMIDAYRAFERVRLSGVTNMIDRPVVCVLAGITQQEYMYVINNYEQLRRLADQEVTHDCE